MFNKPADDHGIVAINNFTDKEGKTSVHYFITQAQDYKMKFEVVSTFQNRKLINPIKKLVQIITEEKTFNLQYQKEDGFKMQPVPGSTLTIDCHICSGTIIQIVPDNLKAWDNSPIGNTSISIMIDCSKNGEISEQQIDSFSKLYNGLMKKYGFFKEYNIFNPGDVKLQEDLMKKIINIMK